jgi:hypothetical protein
MTQPPTGETPQQPDGIQPDSGSTLGGVQPSGGDFGQPSQGAPAPGSYPPAGYDPQAAYPPPTTPSPMGAPGQPTADPYAAQPSMGGSGYPPAPMGQAPYAAMPMAPVKSNKRTQIIAIVAAVVVVIAAIGFFVYKQQNVALKVGNCIEVIKDGLDSSGKPTYKEKRADCATETQPNFLIASINSDNSCSGDYTPYWIETSSSTTYYCLMENLQQGICYATSTSDIQGYAQVACDASADFKVDTRVDNSDDETVCTAEEQAVTYSGDVKRTYCVGDPTA